jgi:uncharacterized protein DUF3551
VILDRGANKQETMMRMLLLGLTALTVAVVADVRPSEARSWHPWCATYATNSIGQECLFSSYEQCLATVRGIGGFCSQNVNPPPSEPRRRGHNAWWPFYPD